MASAQEVKAQNTSDRNAQSVTDFMLDLIPGKMLDLQFSTPVLLRMKLMLVGYDVGNYLIVKYPNGQVSEFADVLQTGNVAIVRYIDEGRQGECIAFAAPIRAIINVKNRLIFLEYPKSIENRQLRSSQRLQTHIPGKIEMLTNSGVRSDISLSGIIVDISSKGCQFTFKTSDERSQVKKASVVVSIAVPGLSDPIQVSALVRNSRFENGKVYVGIQFSKEDPKRIDSLLSALAIDES